MSDVSVGDEVLNVSSAREAGERYTDGWHNSNREVGSRARACVCVRACVQSYVRVRMMLNVHVCPDVRCDHAGAGVVSGSDHL